MRIRVRGPAGQSTITLTDSATVANLLSEISEKTSVIDPDIKYGYPPQSLLFTPDQTSTKLSDLQVKLNGEQLIISPKSAPPPPKSTPVNKSTSSSPITTQPSQNPLSLTRKKTADMSDPPELPSPNHACTLTLRIMPDDNSCLFRAFGTAFFGAQLDNMTELRSIIASTIQADPTTYPPVVLEKSPDDYCRWIQTPDAWGGAIELSILSSHFDIEICSVDVQTLRVDRFNEGRPQRCILVYSGIHYDTIALSPSDPPYSKAYAPPEFDTKVFDSADVAVLELAVELCRVLQGKHYYTDTAAFQIRCNVCGGSFVGEKGATEHAKETGHYDFGEAG
ncbi:ubiquitin-specific protease otu1 [Loxospora ochrophaea]|nr:ubiquitin-specific protease otu1 [Loxospora ochrophaea]